MAAEWKSEIAHGLMGGMAAQATTCEGKFVANIAADSQEIVGLFLSRVLERGKEYLDCRFGAGTPEAQAGFADLTTIVYDCARTNLGKLLGGGASAYFSAVMQCVAGKLLGGIVGGGGGIGIGGFVEKEVSRCGQVG